MILLYHECDVYISDMTDELKGLAADDGFYFFAGDFFSEENKELDLMIAIEKERRKKEQK